MEKKYFEVPNDVLTSKDMDYLSDMFQWNYGALKSTLNALNEIESEEFVNIFEDSAALFDDNINDILDILSDIGGDNNE